MVVCANGEWCVLGSRSEWWCVLGSSSEWWCVLGSGGVC